MFRFLDPSNKIINCIRVSEKEITSHYLKQETGVRGTCTPYGPLWTTFMCAHVMDHFGSYLKKKTIINP